MLLITAHFHPKTVLQQSAANALAIYLKKQGISISVITYTKDINPDLDLPSSFPENLIIFTGYTDFDAKINPTLRLRQLKQFFKCVLLRHSIHQFSTLRHRKNAQK
jgi:hypothetical protein